MDLKRPFYVAGLLLLFALFFYFRLTGNENIRPIQFVYIWVIGALSGQLVFAIVHSIKSKFKSND
jgi:uncharacterized membrane protein YcaP (DUF421 family)